MHSREGEENDDKKANVRDDNDMIDYYIFKTVQFILSFFFYVSVSTYTHIEHETFGFIYIVYSEGHRD